MAAPPQLVGQTLSHYRIIEQIGAGGMGVVYRARDEQLERDVAVKVLPIGTLADESARKRFHKEALALAKLSHPSIATIFEFSTQNDTDYLVTEYISGLSLDNKLAAGALSEKEVIGLGIQLAQGLGAAHEQGIVHRDLKPANLRLTSDGRLKILDFGLAQLMPHASEVGMTATLTESQEVSGTLPYMSPEQLRGEPAEARTDIWAAGAVLYEIATAHRPFEQKIPSALTDDIIHNAPRPPRSLRPALSPKLEAVILKCLEKEPGKRYQSARELQTDLERLSTGSLPLAARRRLWSMVAAVAVVVALLAAGGIFYIRRSPKLTDKDTIVLADFANSTGDPVFDDTLKQALTVDLEQSPYLNLVSDHKIAETLKLTRREPDQRVTGKVAHELCQRLGSQAMLEGSIANLGNQYVLGLTAVNCVTGVSLVREQVRANGKEEVLKALDKAAATAREKLGESLASLHKFDKPLKEATTSSLEALQAYSEGKKVQTQKGIREALPFLNRAVELDPNFAVAYVALGDCYSNIGQTTQGMENLRRAFELRGRVSEREKFLISSHYYVGVTGELEKANQQFELWVHDYPRDGEAHGNLGVNYSELGQYDKAVAEDEEALRLDPNNGIGSMNLAFDYLALNRLAEAKTTLEQALQRDPDFAPVHRAMYDVAFLQRDAHGMQQQVAWASGKAYAEPGFLAAQAQTASYFGRLQEARELFRRAINAYKRIDAGESGAFWEADAAVLESEIGNAAQAVKGATGALALAPGRDVRLFSALALARAGDAAQAHALESKLDKEFPLDTIIQNYWLPSVRAQIEINRGNAAHAIELLQATNSYQGSMIPVYLRGRAYLLAHQAKEAAVEFQKIADHPGIVLSDFKGPLARLGLARAYALQGETSKARGAYQDFFALWKDADPDIPILKQAKAEYAKLP